MSQIKDSLGESKKFLLLSLAFFLVLILIIVALKSGIYSPSGSILSDKETYDSPEYVLDSEYDYSIVISTVYGEIEIDLYEDIAPENVNSLLFLMGERYYDGLTFHKVIKDFVIQTGDAKGDGNGNPGYSVKKENLINFKDYDIGMANASQFFIVLPNSSKVNINNQYPVVGRVVSGFAVVDSIAKVEVGDDYKPLNDVVIKNIQIQEN